MAKNTGVVAITGAGGFLGRQLVDYFAGKGWRVVALVRNPDQHESSNRVKYVSYDLREPVNSKSLQGVDYLVHAAYVRQERGEDAFAENVEGAKRLLEAAKAAGVKRRVFISSMSAHSGAVSTYGRQKLAIENIFSGADCITIRSGLIIGNGGLVKQMVDFMRSKHMVPLINGGNQPLQIIALDDLVTVIDKLLTSRLTGLYTVATPQVYSYKELYQTISRQLKIKVLFVPIPFFILLNGLRLANLLPIPIAVNPDNALGLKALRAVDTAPDLKKIGVKLKPLEAALDNIPGIFTTAHKPV